MQAWVTTQGRNLRYAIIGRLNREHDAYGLDPDQIRDLIALELLTFVEASDIVYIAPNYIICLDNPYVQETILAVPTLHTNYFQLHMVAWSKEHELSQLPWIAGPPSEASKITIDPLKILPVISAKANCQGSHRLKDTFAASIPKGYDLRAPDFSYLAITELRQFYETKFSAFITCKQISTAVKAILHDIVPVAEELVRNVCQQVHPMNNVTTASVLQKQCAFINDLKAAVHSRDTQLPPIYHFADSVLNQQDTPLNLQAFKEGPPTNEVPVPPSYAQRLKIIYTAAIQKIHCTTPIVETVKQAENRYATYVTVHDFTRRYFGHHTRNAPGMEAQAIYYALKHLTNVQGYRIMDLNYSILHKLVSDLDGWNIRICKFELFCKSGLRELDLISTNITERCAPSELSKLGVSNLDQLRQSTAALTETLQQLHQSITDLLHRLVTCKGTYDSIRIGVYSPTRSYYHWARAKRPSTICTDAD